MGNPARYGNVTGVGSTGRDNGQYASHSNRGPSDNPDTINPRGYPSIKPQVVAPGVNIRSSVATSDSAYEGDWAGTSMSAPHVTGLVALLWQAVPSLKGHVPETIAAIKARAVPLAGQGGSNCGGNYTTGPNNDWGMGTIDARALITSLITGTLSGTVTITNNILNNARRHGIDIENWNGTISSLTITGNSLTSSPVSTTSLGTGILVLSQGSSSTTSHITTGTISSNTVVNFPSGEGIAVLGGSGNSSNSTSAILGAAGTPILIQNNTIKGQSDSTQHMGSNAIHVAMNSQIGVMNFDISCNGNNASGCTATGPITNIQGQGISVFAGGSITGTTTIDTDALRREVESLMRHFIADYDAVVKSRARALPYMLDAHRRMWEPDVGMNRFIARTR